MTSEVQRPATGGGGGAGGGQDMFRPRPISQGGSNGYRFGQLSHNSFFTRHNPHPNRVRHLKGLLDVPICSVNDDGYFSSPRYSLQFPPNHFNNTKINKWKGRIPVNTVNVNNPLHSINTVTGLQYFMGLNSYPWRERAIPRVGLVPVTEAWRDELKRFAEQLTDVPLTKDPAKESLPKQDEDRPRTTQYSTNTGRLIPPPSRALSRGNSRRAQRAGNMPFYFNTLEHISPSPDVENVVLTMLCQILQTEDINAVQAWLCSAGDREKTMVMEMMKAAMAGREEYWKNHPALMMEPSSLENNASSSNGNRTKLPPIEGAPRPPTGEINRLVLDEGGPAVPALEPSQPPLRTVVDDKDFAVEAPTNSVFRPPSPPKKAASQQPQRPPSVSCAPAAPVATTPAPAGQEEPTTTAPSRPISSTDARLKTSASKAKAGPKIPAPESLAMWNQMESVNTF